MIYKHFVKIKIAKVVILFSFSLFVSTCVSISSSTVQLSTEVGERLSEMEGLHQLAIQRYFEMEQQKIDDFLINTWNPLFLKNFLATSNVLQLLQNVSSFDDDARKFIRDGIAFYMQDTTKAEEAVNQLLKQLDISRKEEFNTVKTTLSNFIEEEHLEPASTLVSSLLGTDKPALIILDFAEAAHQEMQAERKAIFAPIEQARVEVMAELSSAYAELIRGQNTITARLEAAHKRSQQNEQLKKKLHLDRVSDNLNKRMANISSKVNNAINTANDLIESETMGAVLTTLKQDLNAIGNNKDSTSLLSEN